MQSGRGRHPVHRRTRPRCCCSAPAGSQRMGVPLGLVARLEDIPREKIELSGGAPVTQYRGKLMPLIAIDGGIEQRPADAAAAGVRRGRPQHGPDGRRDHRRGGGPAGHRAGRRAARPAGHRGHRRPGDRRARHRLLADAGLAGLVPRRTAPTAPMPPAEARTDGGRQRLLPPAAWCRRSAPPGSGSPPSPARPRRCGCATPARCSTRSCRTSKCRTWTGWSSPARSAPAGRGRTCR